MKRLSLLLTLVLVSALPAAAQQLTLEISDGRVTLDAKAVPARQILSEWARVGGTKVVNGEKVTGAPLTLKLVNVSERQALDIILRNVAGFMAAPRQASAAPGASNFDRIFILATTTSAAAQASTGRGNGAMPANNTAQGAQMNGAQRRLPPRPPNMPSPAVDADEEPEQEEDAPDTGAAQPVFTFPAPPGTPGANNNQVFVPMNNSGAFQPAGANTPVITLQPGPNGPTIYNFVPNTDGTRTTTPPTGFTVIGSPTPGMIQQPPTPVPPPPPTRPPRP